MANYALVVGINCYPTFNNLSEAVADADKIEAWLKDTNGGNVPEANCQRVPNRPLPETLINRLPAWTRPATTDNACPSLKLPSDQSEDLVDDLRYEIMREIMPKQEDIDWHLDKLLRLATENKRKGNQPGRFFFYFSGHGISHDSQEVGLCLPNFSISWKGSNLLMEKYREFIISYGLFRDLIFWLDCCRTRELNAPGHKPNLPNRLLPPGSQVTRTAVFYAAEYLSQAFEAQQGFFTKTLLDGLRGEAADADGAVTFGTLQNYLDHQLPLVSGGRQKASVRLSDGASLTDEVLVMSTPTSVIPTQNKHNLTIELPTGYTDYRLYTAFHKRVRLLPGKTNISVSLNAGRYYLVTEFPERVQTNQFDLPHPTPLVITALRPQSAAVIRGYDTTFEQFGHPVKYLTKNIQQKQFASKLNAELFLFIRTDYLNNIKPDHRIGDQLSLRTIKGKIVTNFEISDNIPDVPERNDYLAYSARIKPGMYLLHYSGPHSRQMPIYTNLGWQTQLFMIFDGEPRFDTTRLFLARPLEGFAGLSTNKQDEQDAINADNGLSALMNIQSRPTPTLLNRLLKDKFKNPMLGIVGLCLLLRGRMNQETWYVDFLKQRRIKPASLEGRSSEIQLFRVIIGNLYARINPMEIYIGESVHESVSSWN